MNTRRSLLVSCVLILTTSTALAVPEICGNGIDDDSDGFTDESCYVGLTTGITDSPLSTDDTGMISPSTGSLYYQLPPDVEPAVPFGPSIALIRTYQSMYNPGASPPTYKKPLGDRWTHNFMGWIVDNGATLIIHMPNGQDVFAQQAGTASCSGGTRFETRAGHATQYVERCSTGSGAVKGYWLKTLEGNVLRFDITSKKITEVRDTLATPNIVVITYDANGQVSTVTDASTHKRLLMSYASGLLTSVAFQTAASGGVWTTRNTTTYGYTSSAVTSVTIGGVLAQTNVYSSGYLTQIQDATAKPIVAFSYDSATGGKAVRVDTLRGMVGFEFASARTGCAGTNKTVLYFNRGNALSCSVDSDCGTGFLCGGKTGSGSTGQCFRAARCLTVDTTAGHHEDLVTSVAPLGPPGESCDGACTDVATYLWNNATKYVASLGIQDPLGNYSARSINANGLPTIISYGDPDSDPTNLNAARTVYLFYDPTFPGRISEIRRKSDLDPNANSCSSMTTTGCARTVFSYLNGLVSQRQDIGTTLSASGVPTGYTYTTIYSYDTKGRLTQIDGPLAGSNDVTVFEYWTSTNFFLDGYLQNYKRKKDTTNFLTSSAIDYDFWGNPIALRGDNTDTGHSTGTLTCLSFDSARGYLAQYRVAMAGQTDCSTPNTADLTTGLIRDSALRLTQVTRPDGSCMFFEYDGKGRLQRTKRRDDCNAASIGTKQEFVYDDEGLITAVQAYDEDGLLTANKLYAYFDSRRLQKIINPVDTSKWMGLVYDARGLLTEKDGANGLSKTVFHIDADDRTTSVDRYKDPTLFDTWNLLYDWLGDQEKVTYPDGKVTETVRDDLGRIVKRTSANMTYPTLYVYDNASRRTTMIEAFGGGAGVQRTHTFTFDNLGRPLNTNYQNFGSLECSGPAAHPEIQKQYDVALLPDGVSPSCPTGISCNRTGGRLAYVKVSLLCNSLAYPDDGSLDQETWYSYDDAGRVVLEYVRDDSGRTGPHSSAWTRNGLLDSVTMPSTTVVGWTYGTVFDGSSGNSDTDLISGQWRTNTSTPITHGVKFYPYGPLKHYDWEPTNSGYPMRTDIARNLAYRTTVVDSGRYSVGVMDAVTVTEDAKGRVTGRDYLLGSNPSGLSGFYDSFFLYDNQDRVTCEATFSIAECPTSGGASVLKNNHDQGFTNAGDWKHVLRPIPGSTGMSNTFLLASGTHQVQTVNQDTFAESAFGYDARGDRIYDDNIATLTNDRRDYLYDGRGNVVNVRGQYFTGGVWHYYDVASAFDAKNRRVYKSFYDETTLKTAQWYFYYDPLDRLTEIRHTPDSSVPGTYSQFQLFWLGDRLDLFWQTDYPSATTSKRYTITDETGRIYGLVNWAASGDVARYWWINPSAWGIDTPIDLGQPGILQPMLFAGQYCQCSPESA